MYHSGNHLDLGNGSYSINAKRKASVISVTSARSQILKSTKNGSGANSNIIVPLEGPNKQTQFGSLRTTSRETMRFPGPEDDFEPIKGPIHVQMFLHYLWFGAMMIVAWVLNWIPNFFAFILVPYALTAYYNIQISRLVFFFSPLSMVPLYVSFLPFMIMCVFSREAHLILSLLWYISVMTINMQSGSTQLWLHVLLGSLAFIATYTGSIFILQFVFTGTYDDCYFCSELDSIGDIHPGQEYTFGVSIVLLGFALYMLEQFIKKYALTLIDRENHVHNLYLANMELKKELRKIKSDTNLDLDAPIVKVIQILQTIQNKPETDPDVVDNLDTVIQILSSNLLFAPNLNFTEDVVDSDVNSWLNSMVYNNSKGPNESDINAKLPKNDVVDSGIAEVLERSDQWGFDVFELAEITNGRPLYYLGCYLFDKHNFRSTFQIEESKLKGFLEMIEGGYKKSNPYHNSIHATDVMQTMNYFIMMQGMGNFITIEDCFAAIVACMIHDFEHPGANNAFLIQSEDPLAIRYNDKSVLENYHCARTFELILARDEVNILSSLSNEKYKQIRECILSLVLATDMAFHFQYITKFKNKISGSSFNFEDSKDRQLLMDVAIKCADISNAAKPRPLCKKWCELIMEEFFQQGDEERRRGLPVSVFMDRATTNIPKCQVGFIDFLCGPLYEAWDSFMNESGEHQALTLLSANREHWKSLQAESESGTSATASASAAQKDKETKI